MRRLDGALTRKLDLVGLRGLLPAALCAALLLGAPSSSHAAEKSIWGPVGTLPGGGAAFDLYRRLGVDTVQVHLRFEQTAPVEPADPRSPNDPAYSWPVEVDRAVQEASRTGIQIALQVSKSPKWSNGGRGANWSPRPRAFADFLTAAAARYPTVLRGMVWVEPNVFGTYQPNREGSRVGPQTYAKLLDASFVALKEASARNIVIGGMTFTGGGFSLKPTQWLKWMRLPGGRPPRLDWYGHNPFSTRFPDLRDRRVPGGFRDISDMDLFSREVARVYTRPCGPGGRRRCGRRPKLWLSEYVIQSDHGSNTFSTFVSREGQAEWLTGAFKVANALPSVAGLGWLSLLDEPESDLSGNFGLITADGVRKPSFYAFRRAPSRAYRPDVQVRRYIPLARAARDGIPVRVEMRSAGRVTAVLRRRGRPVARRSATGGASAAKLVLTLRAGRLGRGDYILTVDATRGERVVRKLAVR